MYVLFHTEEYNLLNDVTEHSAISVGFYAVPYWKRVILDYCSVLQPLLLGSLPLLFWLNI